MTMTGSSPDDDVEYSGRFPAVNCRYCTTTVTESPDIPEAPINPSAEPEAD